MKKLVIYGISVRGGGAETFLYNFIKYTINSNKYKIYLFISQGRKKIYDNFKEEIYIRFINVNIIHSPIKRIVYENINLYKIIKKINPHIIFIPSEVIPFRWNKYKIPIIINIHSTLQSSNNKNIFNRNLREIYDYIMRKRSIKFSKKIVFVSHLSKAEMCFKFKISENKVAVIYHGISKINNENSSREGSYILSIGDRYQHKNYDKLIKIYMYCKSKYQIIEDLVIIGNSKSKKVDNKINNLIGESIYSNNIKLIENVDYKNISHFYENAKLYITTSSWESFGITPLEAMKYGVPVIAFRNSALAEVYNDKVLFIDPYLDDLEIMADKMYNLLINENLRNKMNIIGKEYVKQMNWKDSIFKYLKLFDKVIFSENKNE